MITLPRIRSAAKWGALALAALAALGPRPAPAQEAGPGRTTLADAQRVALERSPRLTRAERGLDAATDARRSVRGHFGPLVRVEGSASRWNAPLDVAVPLPEVPGYDLTAEPLHLRDLNTRQVRASIVQPLTGVATTYFGHAAALAGERAAARDLDAERRDVVLAVTDAYLTALEAEALRTVAEQAVGQIEAHLALLRTLEAGGLAQKNDVLEAEARLAETQASLVRAKSAVDLARSNLAVQMGLGPEQPVVPAPVELTPPPLPPEAEAAPRPELEAAMDRAKQASHAAQVRWMDLAPQLDAVARWQRTYGSALAGKEEAFVGATLSWNVFEWGSTYYEAREAEDRAAQADAAVRELADGLALQTVKARRELEMAKEQVDVVQGSIDAAEENVRLEKRRFEAGASTSTDVLDAEALLARAQARLAAARYELLAAHAALRHALGITPILALRSPGPAPAAPEKEAPHAP